MRDSPQSSEHETFFEGFVRQGLAFTISRPGLPDERISFRFEDDEWHLWDILKPSEREGHGTIKFHSFPSWLCSDVKLYMAHLWLRSSTYSTKVQTIMRSLRYLGDALPTFRGRPIDLRKMHAVQFFRSFSKQSYSTNHRNHVFRYVNDFMSFVRLQNPKVKDNDFVIEVSRRRVHKQDDQPLAQPPEKKIPTEIIAAVIDACDADLRAYVEARCNYSTPDSPESIQERSNAACRRRKGRGDHSIRPYHHGETPPKLRILHCRAIKAQVVKLLLCVGRRASAVCNSSADIRTREINWTNEAGVVEKAILVRFRETKIRNVDEDVVCPGAYGEIAAQAIKIARELTADLRRDSRQWADCLFLVPVENAKRAQVVSLKQINQYLNGASAEKRGLLQRYNIPWAKITTHHFRSTRATNLWVGGMQIHEISDDLGHRGSEMVLRHYIVGTEESMRRYQLFVNQKALSGAVVDFAGGQEVVNTRLNARHVEITKGLGLVVVPTRYGYCARHASLGPCDRTTPCYTGPGGIECDSHVLSPDALPALYEDGEVVETNIASYRGDPQYASWVQNNRNQLEIITKKIEQANVLKSRAEGAELSNEECDPLRV